MIFCKILITIEIYNATTNELTLHSKPCRNDTKFYRQELASLF